tara:strand:+ start:379 stop:1950 length:1572 start_codon:yes stop_codon:yes gene_type:complete
MPATLATFASILKEFYIGPILDQLNNEVLALELMEKATIDWNGRVAIMPIHVSRNTGVAFRGETGVGVAAASTLPAAGEQGYERLQIEASFQYGRFQVSGPAIAAAKTGGVGSFISYTDAEMKKLAADVRNQANQTTIFGGRVRGYLNERCDASAAGTGGATAGPQLIVGAAMTQVTAQDFQYQGDFTVFAGAQPALANFATWVPVDLIRTDTYNPVTLSAGATNPNFWVRGINPVAGTISIAFGTNAAGGGSYITSDIAPGFGVAVSLRPVQAVDNAGAPVGVNNSALNPGLLPAAAGAVTVATFAEANGIYTNLSSAAHYGVTRNVQDGTAVPAVAADGAAPSLRGHVQVNVPGGAAFAAPRDQGRAVLALPRMTALMDAVDLDPQATPGAGGGTLPGGGGEAPDIILLNPVDRQAYIGILNATIQMNPAGTKAKGDGSFLDIAFAGVPIRTSRACHRRAMIFMRKDSWCLTELQSPGFADLDGNVLSRVGNSDAFEGYYRWYWNVVAKHPNNNCILIGYN